MTQLDLQVEAIRLREEEGYSIREIAEQLSTPKTTIAKWIASYDKGELDLSGLEEEEQDKKKTASGQSKTGMGQPKKAMGQLRDKAETETELGILKENNRHKEAMYDKELRKKELELQEQEADLHGTRLEILNREESEKKEEKKRRIEAKKELLFKKYVRLILELKKQCSDHSWEVEELEDYQERIGELCEKIEVFCEKINIDHEELALYNWLLDIDTLIEEILTENAERLFPKKSIVLDFDKETVSHLKEAAEVEYFEEELSEEEEEDDEDFDDEDEEEEDED